MYDLKTFHRFPKFRAVYVVRRYTMLDSKEDFHFALLLSTPRYHLFACCCAGSCLKTLMQNVIAYLAVIPLPVLLFPKLNKMFFGYFEPENIFLDSKNK